MILDIGKWHGRLLSTPATFEKLVGLAEHPDAAAEYKRSWTLRSIEENGEVVAVTAGELVDTVRDSIYGEVLSAIDHYASLMVVTAATYIENILLEFLTAYFTAKPEAIHSHLMPTSAKREEASVPLREVLAAPTLSELRAQLAMRAARNATDGPIQKVFNRIFKLTGHRIPKEITAAISDIVLLRNSIVHDGKSLTKSKAAVAERFAGVLDLLTEIARICKAENLPYVDGGGLIDDLWQISAEIA